MNKILITIIFILLTNTALSNTFVPTPSDACTKYLNDRDLKRGLNERSNGDGTFRKFFLGIGSSNLSEWGIDKKGKAYEIWKYPTDQAVLYSQQEAIGQALSSLLAVKGVETMNIPVDKNLDIDVKIKAVKIIFNQKEESVCSVIVIIPNN